MEVTKRVKTMGDTNLKKALVSILVDNKFNVFEGGHGIV
jgi:hypothetical protein